MPRILNFVGRSPTHSPSPNPSAPQTASASYFVPRLQKEERRTSLPMDFLTNLKDKRKSVVERPPSRKNSAKPEPPPKAQLQVQVESPPLILHGPPESSTGALLSGQLKIKVTEAEMRFEGVSMALTSKRTSAKPAQKECTDCAARTIEVRRWDILTEPKTLPRGEHNFPFSHLLDGTLPASTVAKLGNISYNLAATARLASGEELKTGHSLLLRRALPEPTLPRTSQRIFPPTNLKMELEHPPLVYPLGQFKCLWRMTGVLHSDRHARFRWCLRRLSWTLNENSRILSPACPRHANVASSKNKTLEHTDTRPIGGAELRSGWKADYSPNSASIEIEFTASPDTAKNPACDVDDKRGFVVSHTLTVEMIVAEEIAGPRGSWGATGTARILRTQHHIHLTERASLGVSWDEEMPPNYEDVPESPPWYPADETEASTAGDLVHQSTNATMHDYVGEAIPPVEDEVDLQR